MKQQRQGLVIRGTFHPSILPLNPGISNHMKHSNCDWTWHKLLSPSLELVGNAQHPDVGAIGQFKVRIAHLCLDGGLRILVDVPVAGVESPLLGEHVVEPNAAGQPPGAVDVKI